MLLYVFLTTAAGEDEWSVLCVNRFVPEDGTSGTNCVGGWVNPIACLGAGPA
jgi:hypothetical protein